MSVLVFLVICAVLWLLRPEDEHENEDEGEREPVRGELRPLRTASAPDVIAVAITSQVPPTLEADEWEVPAAELAV